MSSDIRYNANEIKEKLRYMPGYDSKEISNVINLLSEIKETKKVINEISEMVDEYEKEVESSVGCGSEYGTLSSWIANLREYKRKESERLENMEDKLSQTLNQSRILIVKT